MASCHTHATCCQSSHRIHRIHRSFFGVGYSPTEFTEFTEVSGVGYSSTEFTEFTEVSVVGYSPTDFTDAHRLGGYGILPYPRSPPNYLPTEVSGGEVPPTEFTEFTEFSGGQYSPTDFTDVPRLEGYGLPAIPTQPPNYLPTEATEPYAA